jgi:hypothetical protein
MDVKNNLKRYQALTKPFILLPHTKTRHTNYKPYITLDAWKVFSPVAVVV